MIKHFLPQQSLDTIDAYWNIRINENKCIRCPYFRNPTSGRIKWALTAYSGKGSPEEIEDELKIVEKLEGCDFSRMREYQIRAIMGKRKLGIECSGFITRVLDAGLQNLYGKSIFKLIKFKTSGFGRLTNLMRPYTHLDVATLVSSSNSRELRDFQEIMPGDIMRFNSNTDHAILVTSTERDDAGILVRVFYVHSVFEGTSEGVKKGLIKFINRKGNLLSQSWSEEPETGHIVAEEGIPRIYRLYVMENKI